jgi:hypothetical protein
MLRTSMPRFVDLSAPIRQDPIAERLTAQLLAGEPASDPVAVAERLLAIQGQDMRGARLAVRARTSGLSVADVDGALADHSLLITWVNRGTLHLIRAEDYPWLHALTAPTLLTANGLVDLAKRPPAAAEPPPPRLLGPFEPLLLGWTSREPVLGSNTSVVTFNGIFKPIALVGGRAVATWTMPKGELELEPFGRLHATDRAALETDAADVARFFAS